MSSDPVSKTDVSKIDISSVFNFDDLDVALQQSGLDISSSSKETGDFSQRDLTDPITQALAQGSSLNLNSDQPVLDTCLICCNPLYMKLTLPCRHEFCFNCIKGQIIRQITNCPACSQSLSRQVIDQIMKRPHQVNIQIQNRGPQVDYHWVYSSNQRGQWWEYDLVNSSEIEELFQKFEDGEDITSINKLSICGMTREFDFDEMLQINEYNGTSRRIKRLDPVQYQNYKQSHRLKGIAGYQKK